MRTPVAALRQFIRQQSLKSLAFCLAIGAGCLPAALLSQDKGKSNSASASQHRGSQVFAAHCSSCHGLDGRGSQRAPDIAGNSKLQKASDSEIQKIIREGIPGTGMPAFRSLGVANIQALVRQLRTLQGMESESPLPGSPDAGKKLFFGKATCSECHLANGSGGFLGSDLSAYARGRPATEIRESLTNESHLQQGAGGVTVTMVDGTKIDGIVRNEDNFTLQLQTRDGAFQFFDKSQVHDIQKPGPLMPADFGSSLTPQEIDDIVSYLIGLSRGPSTKVGGALAAESNHENEDSH